MWRSETYGELEIEKIPERLLEFYDKMKAYDTAFQIIVGTDSQNHYGDTKIVTVIAVVCEGHGGIYFYQIEHMSKITNVRQKLFTETGLSIVAADRLLELLESDEVYAELYSDATFTIHVDAGHSEKGKTKELIPAIVGWIKSVGYESCVKPDSFVSSSIADRISK